MDENLVFHKMEGNYWKHQSLASSPRNEY